MKSNSPPRIKLSYYGKLGDSRREAVFPAARGRAEWHGDSSGQAKGLRGGDPRYIRETLPEGIPEEGAGFLDVENRILKKFLDEHRKVGIDTPVFIFQVEANPRYVQLTHQVFKWLGSSRNAGVTSTI